MKKRTGSHVAADESCALEPAVSAAFARDVIAWQRVHGRHDLPWQNTRDAYRIWISEIMLQQTQVATVIPYFDRFMLRFPDVGRLAASMLDDVLAHWSGLGYYSRARNLHRAAQLVCERHGGRFPERLEDVAALPGIGRSTAAAIVVFAHDGCHAILDGNVKRVLARVCGIPGYPGEKRVSDALWRAAEALLPNDDLPAYTQGMMDLGATVCVRRQPLCAVCPLAVHCVARREQRVASIPAARPRKTVPHRHTTMLIVQRGETLLFEKRPAAGIWGGLWCFPEAAIDADAGRVCEERLGARVAVLDRLPPVEHGFTHYTLTIVPQRVEVQALLPRVAEPHCEWMSIDEASRAGIPAPVRRILRSLAQGGGGEADLLTGLDDGR
jgi:A/G-specific adenine glycosylase